ncbi:MAG: hypothetical protein GF411_16065 [Candidatus Lokiarchaeota archaeon]|nr:hypothetical protein [Candidatus Lokiarchaeota archaeon]
MEISLDSIPDSMKEALNKAVEIIKTSKKPMAISHIDADGITAMAIVVFLLERAGHSPTWQNIHQLNSDTIFEVRDLAREHKPDLMIFSDLGTGQIQLIKEYLENEPYIRHIIILDHHLPPKNPSLTKGPFKSNKILEINPSNHDLSGSYDVSGAGVSFLLAYSLSTENADLSELAIVGASGDLQAYYGKGFVGVNEEIIKIGEYSGFIRVDKDLTFFGINTRPLPQLLEYATDPYLPGITGDRDACYKFYNDLSIPLKDDLDRWRIWMDLCQEEKQQIIQALVSHILQFYENPRIASGIVGNIITLPRRPERTEMRSAKEFSTLLNACGRNRRADVGVKICLGDVDALREGITLLQQHRANLASALRRLETDGYDETESMYIVNDPETPDTIIGIIIGMAQGSRIIPVDKPVIGVSTNTSDDGPRVKISGRAKKSLVKRGLNLKEVFSTASTLVNESAEEKVAEAGGHPMAAGAFVHEDYLDEFLELVSVEIRRTVK